MIFKNKNKVVTDEQFWRLQNIRYGEEKIKIVTEFKFLGIVIDNLLNWNLHIGEIGGRVVRIKGVINRIGNVFDIKSRREIFFAMVGGIINYCTLIWGDLKGNTKRTMDTIYKMSVCGIMGIRELNWYEVGRK